MHLLKMYKQLLAMMPHNTWKVDRGPTSKPICIEFLHLFCVCMCVFASLL